MLVTFILCIALCGASYHEQYTVPQTCTDKWESFIFEDKEYVIQNIPITWENAKIMCRGHHNGTLAILDTKEKTEFLAEALAESKFELDSVWVGARRLGSDDPAGYRWGNLVELRRTADDVFQEQAFDQYPAWQNRTHVPVPDSGADCVAVQRVSHDRSVFLDLPCDLERQFVCEREAQAPQLIKELKVVRCRTGLYRVYDGRLNWHQAAAYCVLRKMSLANIGTMKCLKKLGMSMLKTRPSIENAWVGARGELGKWQWIDTGASIFLPSPYSDVGRALWPPMRDRTALKQNGCLQLDRHATHAPVFLEARCERKMQFICYQGLPALRTPTTPHSDDLYYYVLVKQLLLWSHAYENCNNMNGSLAYPDNPDILTQLLLMMGENKEEPIEHIWISGRLNMTRDITTDDITYSWYNPMNNKVIPDPKTTRRSGLTGMFMAPWLDEEFSRDNSCLNLDRQDHLKGLVYGLPCNTPQYSICMIVKSPRAEKKENVLALPTQASVPDADVFVRSEIPQETASSDTKFRPFVTAPSSDE